MSKGRHIHKNKSKHEIRISVIGKLETWYVAVCSCGGYRSNSCAYPGLAEQAGKDHVEAMK